jgi:nucleotide-binding universal stress UspA family protein
MVHLWHKVKEETKTSKGAPGIGAPGDIAVIVDGNTLDHELVHLVCLIAKRAKRKVHLVHIIEVPRTLPLKATLTKESENADKLLNEALALVDEAGCEAVAEVVQTRDAGSAIVDEAKDQSCALLMLGLVRNLRKGGQGIGSYPGKTISYVLAHAPCRVWLVWDAL